jgi:predicted TIM-barrel fold metal-dependent hydrolase
MATMSQDEYTIIKVRERGRGGSVTFIPEPAAEPLFCPVISVDDHLLEPGDLFEHRLPAKYRDSAPYLGPGEDGAPWWQIGDTRIPILMSNGAAGRVMTEWGLQASRPDEEFRRGVWDSKARLRDLDIGGVWATLCFPSILFGFAGWRFSRMPDPELGLACVRAYNDWMLEEWCGAAPERYIPCQIPWLSDPELGAQEIRRNAARGVHAVSFSENPEALGFANIYDRVWDPFFAACEETGTVVNLHVGSSGTIHLPSSVSHEAVGTALFPVSGLEALVDWTYSGLPVRFPGLKVALSEAGISWVPMAKERLRRAHRQADGIGKGWPKDAPTPVEVVERNFFFTSIEDPSGFQLIDLIGRDKVMVETDYPHFDSTWPQCQAMIRSELAQASPALIRMVCYENAARLYNHPLPPAEMIQRSEIGAPETSAPSQAGTSASE